MLSSVFLLRFLSGLNVGYALLLTLFRISTNELYDVLITVLEDLLSVVCFVLVHYISAFHIKTALIFVGIQFMQSLYIHRKHVIGSKYKNIDLDGKVYIVTGCNTGIGYETAAALVSMNATVVMACRSISKATAAREQILREVKCAPTKLHVIKLDLCGFDSVRKFVKAFKELQLPLHGLINNASVMLVERLLTQDGFEMVFTSNHLSHFLLTNLLLPTLELNRGRVITVSSSAHHTVSSIDFTDIMSEKQYDMAGTYARSKMANILFTKELQRRLLNKNSAVACYAVHPGCVRTESPKTISSWVQIVNRLASPLMLLLQKTPQQGAYCTIFAATDPSVYEDNSCWGGYFFNCQLVAESVVCRDPHMAENLWGISEKLTGIRS